MVVSGKCCKIRECDRTASCDQSQGRPPQCGRAESLIELWLLQNVLIDKIADECMPGEEMLGEVSLMNAKHATSLGGDRVMSPHQQS